MKKNDVKKVKVSKRDVSNSVKDSDTSVAANLSGSSWALLFGVAEQGAALLSDALNSALAAEKKVKELQVRQLADSRGAELKNLTEDSARTILWRLQQKGLVTKNAGKYELTDIGEDIVENFNEQDEAVQWDGKWRIIMFDIPEQKRNDRNWLRWHLQFLDYRQFQKSVFVGREPLEEEFYNELLERDLKECVRLLTVGDIDDVSFFENFE